MKFWFDTEFIEDGRTIDLVSIGIVSEDGRRYYAVSSEFDPNKACQWVKDNVLNQLLTWEYRKPRVQIAQEIREFVGEKPEFWAYYGAYDWVSLCQLYGTLMQLPDGWPKYCRDLKQWCDMLDNPKLPEQESVEHHALNDAIWTKKAWEWLASANRDSDPEREEG